MSNVFPLACVSVCDAVALFCIAAETQSIDPTNEIDIFIYSN